MPAATVPRVGHQLPARVARDQTAFVGGILLSNIVSTEETLAATAQHSPPRFLKFYQKLLLKNVLRCLCAVLVDEELLVTATGAQRVGGLDAHINVGLAVTASQQ